MSAASGAQLVWALGSALNRECLLAREVWTMFGRIIDRLAHRGLLARHLRGVA